MRMSRRLASFSNGGFKYTYTGTSSFVGDPKKNWILYLTGSGTLNIQGFPKGKLIDVCVIWLIKQAFCRQKTPTIP